jgi:hypothetical protein
MVKVADAVIVVRIEQVKILRAQRLHAMRIILRP